MFELVSSAKRWLIGVTAAVALVSVAAGTTFAAAADGKTASTAVPVAVSTTAAPLTGSLVGDSGGSFVYYAFTNPSPNALETVSLAIDNADLDTVSAVGATMWDSNGNEIVSMTDLGAQPGSNSVTFSTAAEGQVLIQVYNYSNATVRYSLSVAPAVDPVY